MSVVNATRGCFFTAGGAVRPDAPSYVERQCDRDLLEALRGGEFCYVLTSRQMGKSSLAVHTRAKLRKEGAAAVVWDLAAIGQNLTPEQWYDGLCVRMGELLQLEDELDAFWRQNRELGPCQRLFTAIREVVLPSVCPDTRPAKEITVSTPSGRNAQSAPHGHRLVIFVDELDMVRSLPFPTDEFFAAVRECYNRRVVDPAFEQVTFCLLGVATPADLIQDTRITPFNIGRRIELTDFTDAEAAPLARGLVSSSIDEAQAVALLRRILYWTRGHPYLTQRLCQAVAEGLCGRGNSPAALIDSCCTDLFFVPRARERDDNLIFVRERLLRSVRDRTALLHLYEKVLRGRRVPDDETNPLVSVLRLSGVVEQANGRLVLRNRIYRRAFDRDWIRARLPDAEVRRQRAAFYRGVARATGIAAVVVVALTVMMIIAIQNYQEAKRASALALVSQARANRQSGTAGQRVESLQTLRDARPYYTNDALLREEVIACLALPDLQVKPEDFASHWPGVFDVHLEESLIALGETNGTISLRRRQDGRILKTLPSLGSSVTRLQFGPTNAVLLAGYAGGTATVWDWEEERELFSVPHDIEGQAVDFSVDGWKLALGQTRGAVVVYALPEGKKLREWELTLQSGRPRVPQALRLHPGGRFLAESSLADFYVQVWDLDAELGSSSAVPWLSLFHPAEVYDMAWHPRGELLATACGDFGVYIWSTNSVDRKKVLMGHEDRVSAVAFNHRGTMIASLGEDETIRLWMPASEMQVVGRMKEGGFDRLQFSAADDHLVAKGASVEMPRVWEVYGREFVALHIRTGPVDAWRNIDFSPDSRYLTAVNGQRALVWNAESGCELSAVDFANAQAAWFTADSRHLVASSDAGLFCSDVDVGWVGYPGGTAKPLPGLSELGVMAVNRDRSFAAISRKSQVDLVCLKPDQESVTRTLELPDHYHYLALHPDTEWMAGLVAGTGRLHLYDLAGETERPKAVEVPGTEHFGFSPDGRWLGTCWSGNFDFYRVGEWREPAITMARPGASDQHAPFAFTRDGSILAVAMTRYQIQLFRWRGEEGCEPSWIATLEAPKRSPLEMLAFSPDSRRLAAATQDQTIQLWDLKLLRDGLEDLDLQNNWLYYPRNHELSDP